VAIARLGREHRNAELAAGRASRAFEAALEIDVHWLLRPGLTMQPLVQRVWNVAGRPATAATVVGARWVWSLGDAGG
jgi:carbohydrate-selective porin OprB